MAVRGGFEPPMHFRTYTLSRRAPSTTRTSHRFEGENVRYEFVRKIEDQVKIKRSFTELSELFKFLGDYLDPVSLGNLGVKIGNLGVKAE